ncbi:MAG: hypothetical protein OXU28_12690 [Chloroflexota bacterium]|nr:hypothetical protein [Chloroflexota bacterium]
MTYKTRKRIWPVAVVSLAVFGLLAAAVALYALPTGTAQAHDCDDEPTALAQAQCDTLHEVEGENHDQVPPNQAPTVDAPDMDEPIEIEGLMVEVDGATVPNTHPVPGVGDYFSDPDGDDLEFAVGSSDTSVATGMLNDDGDLVITAHDAGEATITVTATDPDGAQVMLDIMVSVRLSPAERYTITPRSYMFDAPETQQVTFTVSAVDADNTPLDEDATVNFVMQQFPADGTEMPLVTRVIGWDSSTDNNIEDDDILQGLLTVRATDPDGERGFTVYFQCFEPGEKVEIDMLDEVPQLVGEATISCKAPPVPPPPPDDEFRSDMMTVVSYNDWDHWEMHETVSDGFIIDADDDNVRHIVNEGDGKVYDQMGVLVRDEPVVDDYQLAISEEEHLELMSGSLPRRTKMQAEEGQHTVEVGVGADYVQLTVTSVLEGPAYIRFLDSDMEPFGTDVDEEPMWRGADVVGLDSQGRLALNMMPALSDAQALAYDQYRVVIPGPVTGNAYLDGVGGDYYQGTFRFFNPCPSDDHHFYVEVYEREGKYLKTTEKIDCVISPRPGPTGLSFRIYSEQPGIGDLTFRRARNAGRHDVLLIDAENRNIVQTVEDATSPVRFDNLNNGWTYHLVVVAEGVDNQYTAHGVKYFHVEWFGEDDIPLSTAPSDAPDHTHPLCQADATDYAEARSLLAKCDTEPVTPPELGEPEIVSAMVDDSDPGAAAVVITWTNGANADGHEVGLVDLSDYSVRDHRVTDGRTSHTFGNVESGRYMAIVVSTMDAEFEYDVEIVTVP